MNSLISKLLGTAVGVKIGNDTIIGLLVGVAWDENLQISELSLSPSENNVNTYLIDTYIMPYFDEYLNVVVYILHYNINTDLFRKVIIL